MNRDKLIEEIHAMMAELTSIKATKGEDQLLAIRRGLKVVLKWEKECSSALEESERRANEILNAVMALATLDYSVKAEVSDKADSFDAISTGINMLGEELKASTVSLKEKEVLLKEVHHRVKNNLQVISSLLSLQSGFIENEFFQQKMNECRDRIKSMALIHEKLYQSGNLSELDFGSYLEELTRNLNRIYNTDNNRVQLNFINKAPDLRLKIDTAVPCGLIINEVLINAFKYAFPGKKSGKITVKLEKVKGKDDFSFTVSDNGVGMSTPKFGSGNTLGLQLVEMLSEQLQAITEFSGNKGVSYTFRVNPRLTPLK